VTTHLEAIRRRAAPMTVALGVIVRSGFWFRDDR